MKPRMLFVMHYLEIGGAETALIGLLNAIDYTRYDVDLFLHSHRGEMIQFIPNEVNLLPEIKEYAHIECPMKQALLDGCWGVLYGRLKAKWLTRRYKHKKGISESAAGLQYVAKCVSPFLPRLYDYGEYDLAVSFLHPHNYVLIKVKAKKKVCWIHTDYSKIDVNTELELPIWSAYDRIISISSEASKTFLNVFPSLDSKVVVMENILSQEFVRQRAELIAIEEVAKEMPKEEGVINLLSVGRFCEAKNYDNVPDICKRVNSQLSSFKSQLSVRWYLIGWGNDESLIRQKIEEAGMKNSVFLLGKKDNPYPYIKACEIYCQPSRYEGKSVTVREAQVLCKPVVITDYSTAKSQIRHGMDGVIVPLDNEECARGIAEFILNMELQASIVKYLQQHDYGNVTEIQKLYMLIDE